MDVATDGRNVYVNAAFEKSTGYPAEEMIGRSCKLLKSGSHPRQLYDEPWSSLPSGQPSAPSSRTAARTAICTKSTIISPILGADRQNA